MKANSLLFSFFVIVLSCSFAFLSSNYNIKVKNLENRDVVKDGIYPKEFAELSVESNEQNRKVKSLQVTLARGNRAVEITEVSSSKFDLGKYTRHARSGDRIVVEIRSTTDLKNQDAVITIKVN